MAYTFLIGTLYRIFWFQQLDCCKKRIRRAHWWARLNVTSGAMKWRKKSKLMQKPLGFCNVHYLDQLYKVESYKSVIELREKIFELHEGTWDSKIAKCDLLAAQIQNFQMKEVKSISPMHGRFKEIINRLHGIAEHIENHDPNIIRYTLKVFPHIILYAPMVDAYKVSFNC